MQRRDGRRKAEGRMEAHQKEGDKDGGLKRGSKQKTGGKHRREERGGERWRGWVAEKKKRQEEITSKMER